MLQQLNPNKRKMFQPFWFLRVLVAVVLPAIFGYVVLWTTMLKEELQKLGLVQRPPPPRQENGRREAETDSNREERSGRREEERSYSREERSPSASASVSDDSE